MKLSDKRRTELYSAISDTVMDFRLQMMKELPPTAGKFVDDEAFKLTNQIWRRVRAALKLEGEP